MSHALEKRTELFAERQVMLVRRAFTAIAALAIATALPAHAGFLTNVLKNVPSIKRGPPTPPPAHKSKGWDWIGKPQWLTTRPRMTGIATEELCSWVAYDRPFAWRFVVENVTARTVSFDWAPFVYEKNDNPAIPDTFIQHVTLKPHQWAAQNLSQPLGCPNMRGGQSDNHYYYVIGDNIKFAGQRGFARSGFFTWWNDQAQQVANARAAARYSQERDNEYTMNTAMQAVQDGLNFITPTDYGGGAPSE